MKKIDVSKQSLKQLIWDSLKAPLLVALVFGAVFFGCFYLAEYPSMNKAITMGLAVFFLILYAFVLKQLTISLRFLKAQEKRLGYRFENGWQKDPYLYFVSRHGPYFTILNREDIKYVVETKLTYANEQEKNPVSYEIVYNNCKGDLTSFYLTYRKEEKNRFFKWYDQEKANS